MLNYSENKNRRFNASPASRAIVTAGSDPAQVRLPEVVVGDRDPVQRLYVMPLEKVRQDWPVALITNAGHITCILKEQFRKEILGWIKTNTGR